MIVIPFATAAQVREAAPAVAAHLAGGGVLAHPTETVYGLGGRAQERDLDALFALKARSEARPVLLLVSSRRMAEAAGLTFSPAASGLAAALWPGPLTLVLPCASKHLPLRLRGASGGVGVRWTSHAGMAVLIDALGHPLTSTSANRSGEPASTTAALVEAAFAGAERLAVLDGGALTPSAPSTVIDCTGVAPKVLREGAIGMGELRRRAGQWAP